MSMVCGLDLPESRSRSMRWWSSPGRVVVRHGLVAGSGTVPAVVASRRDCLGRGRSGGVGGGGSEYVRTGRWSISARTRPTGTRASNRSSKLPKPGLLVALCAALVCRVDRLAPRPFSAPKTDRRRDPIRVTEFDMPTSTTRPTKRVPLRVPVLQHGFELRRPARWATIDQTTGGVINCAATLTGRPHDHHCPSERLAPLSGAGPA